MSAPPPRPHITHPPPIGPPGNGPAEPRAPSKSATLHTATAKVNGRSETVLVNARGLPLYYYQLDTAKKSLVTGELAQLWPPLLAARPTETGATGRLTVVKDPSGHQVAYNGHFLYTFADDGPRQVNGQGVQDFFIATPSLKAIGSARVPQAMTATTSGSYKY